MNAEPTVLRKFHEKNFTHFPNELLNEKRISDRARGLAVRMLSKKDNWIFSAERLAEGATEGRDAVRSALNELALAGYYYAETTRDSSGRFRTTACISDTPKEEWALYAKRVKEAERDAFRV